MRLRSCRGGDYESEGSRFESCQARQKLIQARSDYSDRACFVSVTLLCAVVTELSYFSFSPGAQQPATGFLHQLRKKNE